MALWWETLTERKIMKMFLAFVVFALSASVSVAQAALPSSFDTIAQSLSSTASSTTHLPEVEARKGSKRVGGYTSKGKGSRYIGGRR
jgi:starvation-inducible outer membrane lipoprotein